MDDEGAERRREPRGGAAPIGRDALRCSFCGKTYADVQTMICGPTASVAICNECVGLCAEIMAEEDRGPTEPA